MRRHITRDVDDAVVIEWVGHLSRIGVHAEVDASESSWTMVLGRIWDPLFVTGCGRLPRWLSDAIRAWAEKRGV